MALPRSGELPLAKGIQVTVGTKLNAGKVCFFVISLLNSGQEGEAREILSLGEREDKTGTETCTRSFGPTKNPVCLHWTERVGHLHMLFSARLARYQPFFSCRHTPIS